MEEAVLISRRLTYILRYGALNEGLDLHHGGFVLFSDLVNLNMLSRHTPETIRTVIEHATTSTGEKRFEWKTDRQQRLFVRSRYRRTMHPLEKHHGTNVSTLLNTSLNYVCENISKFDMTDFPDEYLLGLLFHKLKRDKRLTSKAFESLLSNQVRSYNFFGIYLTDKTMRVLCKRCKQLEYLGLRDCGYIVTDHLILYLAKNLTNLRSLNISHCTSVTSASLQTLARHLSVESLNVSHCSLLTQENVQEFVRNCPTLVEIYLHGLDWVTSHVVEELQSMNQHLKVYHQNATYSNVET